MWGLFSGLIVITLFVLSYSRLYIQFDITVTQSSQKATVYFYYYKIQLLKRNINLPQSLEGLSFDNKDIPLELNILKKKIEKVIIETKKLNRVVTFVLSETKLHQVEWHTRIGTGQADVTAIIVGTIWGLKEMIIKVITIRCDFHCKPYIFVLPNYKKRQIESRLNGMVSMKIGQATFILFKLLKEVSKKKVYI